MRRGLPVRISTGRIDQINNLQNRVASRCANGLLRVMATREYREWIAGAIAYGMNAAADNVLNDRPAPPRWQDQPTTTRPGDVRGTDHTKETGDE